MIHTDTKPYQCDQCEQAFRQKQLLKRHVNLYHNPEYVPPEPREKTHVCPNNCNKSFCHKGNLIRHMALHDPDPAVREEAMALKMGRQKKINLETGLPMEYDEDDEEEEEDEDEEENYIMEEAEDSKSGVKKEELTDTQVMSIQEQCTEGEDGQQYVVLEVIQVQDNDENQLQHTEEQDPIRVPEDFILSAEGIDDGE